MPDGREQVWMTPAPECACHRVQVPKLRLAGGHALQPPQQSRPCSRFLDAPQCAGDGLHDGLPVVIVPSLLESELLFQESDTGRAAKLAQTEGCCLAYLRIWFLQHGFQQDLHLARLRAKL